MNKILIFSLVFFFSCDCVQHVHGYVYDVDTKNPIYGATISKNFGVNKSLIDYRKVYSTSEGEFEYTSISGGLFGCPNLKLIVTRIGYDTVKVEYPSCCLEKDTILMSSVKN